MRRRRLLTAFGAGTLAATAGCLGGGSDGDSPADDGDSEAAWPTGPYTDYETTTVTVRADDGGTRGTVRAAIAQSRKRRELGLSAAESMPTTGGMLVVYDEAGQHSYSMQDMAFGLDLVYADADREITAIRDAPAPTGDDAPSYTGDGKYMLAVTAEWTETNSVAVGDTLDFEL